MVAKPVPPIEQARILRALADRIEQKGESLPADVLEAIERLADEGAASWSSLSPDEQETVAELAALDVADLPRASGG